MSEPGPIGPGAFVAVVGGSGVGKDSILGYARERTTDAMFVRRLITRPPGPSEDCQQLTEAEFSATEAAGGFAVSWHAHGLGYGLPATVDTIVREGGIAVANVSRTVLSPLAARYSGFRLVRVSVPPEVRAARLAARGRETQEDIAGRIARPDPAPHVRVDLEIVNDGTIAEAGQLLINFLCSLG